jgi:TPR repeat protein
MHHDRVIQCVVVYGAGIAVLAGATPGCCEESSPPDGTASVARAELADGLPDERREFEDLQRRATEGDANAAFRVAERYAAGQGTPRDDKAALQWYRRAADQGHADSMYALGTHHGERRQFSVAAEWFRKATAAGHAGAMAQLGVLHADGNGVPTDPAIAAQWYQRAVDAGSTDGMNYLGVAYLAGEGVEKDALKARALFEQGAALGDASSMYNLGMLYGRGVGIEPDEAKGLEWLRRAASAGSQAARDRLTRDGLAPRDSEPP